MSQRARLSRRFIKRRGRRHAAKWPGLRPRSTPIPRRSPSLRLPPPPMAVPGIARSRAFPFWIGHRSRAPGFQSIISSTRAVALRPKEISRAQRHGYGRRARESVLQDKNARDTCHESLGSQSHDTTSRISSHLAVGRRMAVEWCGLLGRWIACLCLLTAISWVSTWMAFGMAGAYLLACRVDDGWARWRLFHERSFRDPQPPLFPVLARQDRVVG